MKQEPPSSYIPAPLRDWLDLKIQINMTDGQASAIELRKAAIADAILYPAQKTGSTKAAARRRNT